MKGNKERRPDGRYTYTYMYIYIHGEREEHRESGGRQSRVRGGRATESRAKPPPRSKTDFPEGGSNPASGFSKGGRVGGPSTDPGKRRPFGQTGPRDPRGRPDYRKANWEATGGFFPRGRPDREGREDQRTEGRRGVLPIRCRRRGLPPHPNHRPHYDRMTPSLRFFVVVVPETSFRTSVEGSPRLHEERKKRQSVGTRLCFCTSAPPGCVDSAPLENNFTDPLQNKTF